jgi:hypothetical protein
VTERLPEPWMDIESRGVSSGAVHWAAPEFHTEIKTVQINRG